MQGEAGTHDEAWLLDGVCLSWMAICSRCVLLPKRDATRGSGSCIFLHLGMRLCVLEDLTEALGTACAVVWLLHQLRITACRCESVCQMLQWCMNFLCNSQQTRYVTKDALHSRMECSVVDATLGWLLEAVGCLLGSMPIVAVAHSEKMMSY